MSAHCSHMQSVISPPAPALLVCLFYGVKIPLLKFSFLFSLPPLLQSEELMKAAGLGYSVLDKLLSLNIGAKLKILIAVCQIVSNFPTVLSIKFPSPFPWLLPALA